LLEAISKTSEKIGSRRKIHEFKKNVILSLPANVEEFLMGLKIL